MRSSRSNSSASGSTEDSSNADSSGSSVEKDPPVKDGRQLNGSVGQIGQRRASVKSTGSNRSVKSGAKREERKNSHGSEKWKLQLDESGSGSVSDNEASDAGGVTGSTAPSAGNTVKEQAENMKDGNMSSDESDFQGFESTGSETEGLEILSSIIGNCEATDGVGIACLNCDDVITAPTEVVSADSSPVRAEPERERTPVRLMGSPRITSQVRGRGRPRSAGSASSTSSSGVRSGSFGGKRSTIDLTNPAYRKPLEMGWKRELVYRNTGDASSRRMCDIYYYTPMGKKVRSGKEVMENLDGDLTIENFTFFKEPLGVNDPSKEIIRDARRISIGGKDTSPIVGGSLAVKRQAKPKAQQVASPSPAPAKQSLVPKVETLVPKVKEEEDLSKDRPPDSSPPAAAPAPTAQTPPSVDKPPPAVAGPSGMQNKNMQPCVMLSRSFPRIKVANKVTPNKRQTRPLVSPRAGDMEMGMLPPQWKDKQGSSVLSSPGARQISQVKMVRSLKGVRPAGVPTPRDAAVENRKRKAEAEDGVVSKKPRPMEVASNDPNLELHKFMQGFMSHLTSGYNAMLHVFEYLKVQELLRASRVCRLWRSLATHESLWRTVRLKNSPIADWKGCAAALARCGTRHLDMRKMLVPTGRAEDWWASFGANIGRVPSLESVELSRCPAAVVERVAQQCPQLITLSALSIRDQSINLSSVGQLKNLQELRIKNLSGMYINGKLDGLKELTNLKHLSLTMVKNLGHAGCAVLGELNTLETLEIGECCDLPSSFGNQTLSRLSSLHRLRLEKGQGDSCPTFSLLGGVRTLPALVTLELINFDVKPGFDAALARCTNVRRLLIIPTYISQSATTNHTVLSGVTKLGESLTHLVWGVTHELLRVTELFVDQCEDQKVPTYRKKSTEEGGSSAGDSIPVLRPVPGCTPSGDAPDGSPGVGSEWNSGSVSGSQPSGAPQVDILPLTKLQKMLNTSLPRTKIKILKVPFQATWRQYISDSDF